MSVNLAESLNPVQYEAATFINKPLLVVAGAGTGKTRVITYRIAYLVSKNVPSWKILAVTFTNKAAQEMESRVNSLLGQNTRLNIGTFHSICVKILRSEAACIGYQPNFIIYGEQDRLTLMKQICKEMNINDKMHKPQAIVSRISAAKNQLWTADIYGGQVSNYYDQIVSKVYDQYESRLKKNNAFDFDDLIMQTVRILQSNLEVLEKYQNKFEHVLVDEYQDTNHAQYRLIQLLVGKSPNLCVVGDPDQSIYRWRGADITNILQFEEDYENVKIIRLEQNYRSTQNILKASNSLIENNVQRKEKNLWSSKDAGDKVFVSYEENEQMEANFVVNAIEDLRRKDGALYSDIVIFYRTHAQSRVIEEAARFAGIPYDIVGGVSFYERKEVKDVLAYLVLLVCPEDEVALRRIINVPSRGLGAAALDAIVNAAKENNKTFNEVVWDAIILQELPPRVHEKIKKFSIMMDELRQQMKKLDVASLIREVLAKTDYFKELEKEEKVLAETRRENVRELVSAAEDYAFNEEDPSLEKFLESITLVSKVDSWQDSDQKLTLMTMHCAKGLEFKYVLMIGMEEGLFPHSMSLSDMDELEEERRLCYVGMTRAKEKLFLSHVEQRMLYGKKTYSLPSRFLSEMPRDLVQLLSGTGVIDADLSDDVEKQEVLPSFSIGQKVKHAKFGVGKILEVEYLGDDVKVQVMFKSHVKWLMANFAKLSILDEEEF